MGRRSTGGDPNEALDLFLDAISNTFGGVLFIALLVVVLLSLSGLGGSPTKADAARVVRMQSQLSLLDSQIATVRAALAGQSDQLEQLQQQTDVELTRRFILLQQEHAQEQTALAAVRQAVESAGARKAALDAAIREATRRIEQVRRGSAVQVRLPQFRQTQKKELPLLVAGGRMAWMHRYESGEPVARNADDHEFDLVRQTVRPRPGRGLVIDDGGAFADELARQMRQFNANRHYVAIAVWPDSYEACALVRDRLVAMGFEYNLVLPQEGQGVSMNKGQGGVQ